MKNFGFGCMRLPMKDDEVDYAEVNRMVDLFMEEGFNYYDTAHGYIGGKSEIAVRECLAKRYPRESFVLTNKLSTNYFNNENEIFTVFAQQLEATGVEYFDYYLMHALNKDYYKKYVECNAFDAVRRLKETGKIKHIGISFHDKADVLEQILTEQQDIEVVQIQFNYADYDDPGIESKKCYDVCTKFGKPVIAMEPIKGGALANLPDSAKKIIDDKNDEGISYAGYAVRFCASYENMFMVISGMSDYEQMRDNLSYMKNFKPFSKEEFDLVAEVREQLKTQDMIACTSCQYCVSECPMTIPIPDLFACYNAKKQFNDWNSNFYYSVYTNGKGKAEDCIACGRCETACPQHLMIRDLLKDVSEVFDKN